MGGLLKKPKSKETTSEPNAIKVKSERGQADSDRAPANALLYTRRGSIKYVQRNEDGALRGRGTMGMKYRGM